MLRGDEKSVLKHRSNGLTELTDLPSLGVSNFQLMRLNLDIEIESIRIYIHVKKFQSETKVK